MKKLLLLSATALTLGIGCQNNDPSTKSESRVKIPTTLDFQKPAPGKALTKAQAMEIKNAFNVKSMMILPPGELIFPNNNMSKEERLAKEEELRAKDQNAYNLLKEMQGNCKKGHPTVKFEATFPTDSLNADNYLDILQAGDRVITSANASMVGSDCPVELSGNSGMSAEVKDVNQRENEVAASTGMGSKITAVMRNPKYAQLLGMRGVVMDAGISGVAIRRETEIAKDSKAVSNNILLSYKLSGSYLSLDKEIPYNANVRALLRNSGNQGAGQLEVEIKTELTFPKFKASLVAHGLTSATGGEAIYDIYLNGVKMTEQEIADLFGTNAPGTSQESQKLLMQMLN